MANESAIIDRSSWDEVKIDGCFKALVPPDWEVEEDNDVVIYDPDGFGELSISVVERAFHGGKKRRATRVISGWAEELGISFGQQVTMFKRSRDLLIASAEFTTDEPEGEVVYWRIFPVIGERMTLDISYSCPVEDRDREEAIIEGIIDSIVLIEPREAPLPQGHRS